MRKQIRDLQQAEANLMTQLEAFTPTGDEAIDHEWRSRLQHRFVEVVTIRRAKMDELAKISSAKGAGKINPELVNRLPMITVDLAALPEAHLRRLFDAFQLELRYDRPRHELTIRVTVRADMVQHFGPSSSGPAAATK